MEKQKKVEKARKLAGPGMSVWFWMSKVEFQAKPDYLRYIDVVEQESSNTDIDANDKQDKAQDEAKASPLARWILSLHLTPFVFVVYLCLIIKLT